MIMLLHDSLRGLPGSPQVAIHINSRRLLSALYQELGISPVMTAIRAADKLPKIGADAVRAELVRECGTDDRTAARCVAVAGITRSGPDLGAALEALDLGQTPACRDAIAELSWIFETVRPHVAAESVIVDLSIARGLD